MCVCLNMENAFVIGIDAELVYFPTSKVPFPIFSFPFLIKKTFHHKFIYQDYANHLFSCYWVFKLFVFADMMTIFNMNYVHNLVYYICI